MDPSQKKYILANLKTKTPAQLASELGIKERKIRKMLEREGAPKAGVARPGAGSVPVRMGAHVLPLVLIALAGLLVYANSLPNPFIWDDSYLVVDNSYIKDPADFAKLFAGDIASGADEHYSFYRPLQMVSYMLDYLVWKLKPFGFHLTNILLHVLAAISVYAFSIVLFGRRLAALLAALFFVVHPAHTEAITYISGRSDPMALLFLLATVVFYLAFLRSGRARLIIFAIIFYAAALLSREGSIFLPLLILTYHFTFREKIRAVAFAPLTAMSLAYILLRVTLLKGLLAGITTHTTVFQRLPGAFAALATYLRLLFMPLGLHMEYGQRLFSWADPPVLAGLFCFSGLVAAVWVFRKRLPVVTFAVSWLLVGLLPVSNLWRLNAYMAEHWLYLPSVGVFLTGGFLAAPFFEKEKTRSAAISVAAGLFLVFSALTVRQNSLWRDPIAFYTRTLAYAPDSTKVANNLANAYQETGEYRRALPRYEGLINAQPPFKKLYYNLGTVYKKLGERQKAKQMYEKSIETNPGFKEAYYNLANIHKEDGALDKALPLYEKAVALNPRFYDAWVNMGVTYSLMGQNQKALEAFQRVIDADPGNGLAYANAAVDYYQLKRYDEAIRFADQAVACGVQPNPSFLKMLEQYRK